MSYGSHIRGRVWSAKEPVVCWHPFPFRDGWTVTWFYEVVNTTTGEVLTRDNTGAFEPIVAQCVSDVIALRRVFSGVRPVPKILKARSPR